MKTLIFSLDFLGYAIRAAPLKVLFFLGAKNAPRDNFVGRLLLKFHAYIKYYILLPYAHWSARFRETEILARVVSGGRHWEMFCKPDLGEVDLQLSSGRLYEEEVSHHFARLCEEKTVFLDIGANIGYYTMLANKVNPEMRVHAFEPMRKTYEILFKNLQRIHSPRGIFAYPLALGSKSMRIMIEQKADGGHNSILPTKNPATGVFEEIEVKKATDVIQMKGEKILFKIDVEGYEFEVLKGASGLLDDNECSIILEFTPSFFKHFDGDARKYGKEFLSFLQGKNYKIYELDKFWTQPITSTDSFIQKIGMRQTYLAASNFERI